MFSLIDVCDLLHLYSIALIVIKSLIFKIDILATRSDEVEPVSFTKDELYIPKEGRIYKRKSSLKWKVSSQI